MKIVIPADIPKNMHDIFLKNYNAITKNTENIFFFVADHALEHAYRDFMDPDIHPDIQSPEHMFKIASDSSIGAFVTHLGSLTRYGNQYQETNYIVKITGKTAYHNDPREPMSTQLNSVKDIISLAQSSNLKIRGIAATLYLGSAYEGEMIKNASQAIFDAHQHGLIACLWVYARGTAIQDETSVESIAGCASIAQALGADCVKLKRPSHATDSDMQLIARAAGNTKIVYAGGSKTDKTRYLKTLKNDIKNKWASGTATGRTIFYNASSDAIEYAQTISRTIYEK